MKYWENSPHRPESINLINTYQGLGRIISIKKTHRGIRFREECDKYFYTYFSKEQAIEALQEAIKFIEED